LLVALVWPPCCVLNQLAGTAGLAGPAWWRAGVL